ncbi:MAG: multicopper oxidase domain-containing protein [Alphaproteobacteria bacterium]|nr:multicopper oxidase domain-containing protein [Alphaproteobacteria bacterium]
MNRRQFLTYGGAGAAVLSASEEAYAQATATRIDLSVEPADVELIDGRVVYQLLFYGAAQSEPRPVIRVTEGDLVTVTLRNNAPEPHAFAIPGAPGAEIAAIAPGGRGEVTFRAPRGGTYLYLDPLNAPAHRLLGLHGALISTPRDGHTPGGALTPFSAETLTPATRLLFDAMRDDPTARFVGDPWRPAREKIWLFAQIDPALCEQAELRRPIDGAAVQRTFAPRYFTINGLSGFDSSEAETVKPKGYVGQPLLIRNLNAGRNTHAPHIHGNHVLELSGVGADGSVVVRDNIIERDTWIMRALDRKDLILPFERPQDIPPGAWPPKEEPFPLRYAMHCHTEMSQTAGGGNYPQGLTTHWELLGPTRPTATS